MNWFLHDIGLRHERVKQTWRRLLNKKKKKEEEEHFFPGRSGDDKETVGIVVNRILQTVQNCPKKQNLPNRDRQQLKKL